jgi:DNA-binding transcriptional LysR family regulator
MNLTALDLNLLVVLRALLVERSVTRAARRVGLSQPATSHALSRLRDALGDPLFVRSGRELVPTPRAEGLRDALDDALGRLERALDAPRPFEPRRATRTFTIGTSDYASFVLLPALLARLASAAPGIDLRVRDLGSRSVVDSLSGDELDLAIAVLGPARRPGLRVEQLFTDRFACLIRRDHPRVRDELTLERFVELPHAFVAPRGTRGGAVDDALRARGLERRVALLLPNFLVAPHVVARSDLVVTLGERIARTFAEELPLRVLAPPLPLPPFTMSAVWHDRFEGDGAHAWLRGQVLDAATEIEASARVDAARRRPSRAGVARGDDRSASRRGRDPVLRLGTPPRRRGKG